MPWAVRGAFTVWALGLGSGCVVTTFEAPSEPPRIAPAPSPVVAPESKQAGNAPAPLNPVDISTQPIQIGARHLLVSYKGGLRAAPGIGRSKAEAPAFRSGPRGGPQSPRRPLGRDQMSERVSPSSSSKRLA